MYFQRVFTAPGTDPYAACEWKPRVASKSAGGVTIITPAQWSQTAVDIIAGKYMRKAGVPSAVVKVRDAAIKNALPHFLLPSVPAEGASFGAETDARQVFDRMAGFWTYWGWELGYFGPTQVPYDQWTQKDYRDGASGQPCWDETVKSAEAFYDEIRYMLANQMAAPASPQWFNAGLSWAYGITGSECGQWCIEFDASANGFGNRYPEGGNAIPSTDPYKRPALSACFIQGVEDNLVEDRGIQDLMRREALVFKFGGGSGSNWSNVRGKGEPLSGGGVSSGLLSFLEAPDKSAGAIKSGGTTRRAARMLTLDDDHPELLEFVRWKAAEEKKVAAMAAGAELVRREVDRVYRAACEYAEAPNNDDSRLTREAEKKLKRWYGQALGMGVPKALLDAAKIAGQCGAHCPEVPPMPADFEGVGYSTVQGQNANNSVRVSNEFMKRADSLALNPKTDWHLYGRVEKRKAKAEGRQPMPFKTINASDALDAMAYAGWECGCPGFHYDTTFNEWWTCPQTARINATNPCSEYAAADDTACNLGSLNLLTFVIDGRFSVSNFQHATEIWTTILDITVTAAAYPSKEIAEGSRQYRTLGLGYTNLGAFLMRRGIAYDSPEGRAWAGYLTALLHYTAGIRSARLACELSAFPEYANNEADVLRVMRNHANYGRRDGTEAGYKGLSFPPVPLCMTKGKDSVSEDVRAAVHDAAEGLVMFVERWGLRNAQLTLLAPNGTIGLVMDSDTTGVEPDFALVKWKKLAGGGFLKIVNQSIPHALKSLGYSDDDAEKVRRWVIGSGTLTGRFLTEAMLAIPDAVLEKAGNAISGAMKLADCFAPWVIGEEEFRRVGIDPNDPKKGGAAYLAHFFPDKEFLKEASYQICGRGTVEGCPTLKPEHLPVFDCANKCGKEGKRYLSVDAHLEMMAAVQPVLSGAISKTINFPGDATPQEFRRMALRGWSLGLKACAGFRDGSKMAQPLNTDSDEDMTDGDTLEAATPVPKPVQSRRRKLPNKVKGERTKFSILSGQGRAKFYLRTGDYPDGTLGEIFIDCAKEGATLRGIMSAFAQAVSIGLQHGVPLEDFVESLTFAKFEPNGPIQGHARLKRCDSIIDAIFRELAISYLKRDDLAHVQPEEIDNAGPSIGEVSVEMMRQSAQGFGLNPKLIGIPKNTNYTSAVVATTDSARARERGYTGNRCPNPRCRSFMLVRAGACEKCDACGEQSGCV